MNETSLPDLEALELRTNSYDVQRQAQPMELSVSEIVGKVTKVKQIAAEVMRDGTHFGTIPGTQKPTLYKAGAEILCLTFRLAPKYAGEQSPIDLGKGHREYIVRCELYHIVSGAFFGAGVGSCSTMESKYRYRPGPVAATGKGVPPTYWDLRNSDPAKAQESLGGKGFVARKIDGTWQVARAGETIENPNPADCYNTVLKIAAKRAYVDAVLKATAASEVYTQDLEDTVENGDVAGNFTASSERPEAKDSGLPKQPGDDATPSECPKCKAPLTFHASGKWGPWWSCSTYPKCDGKISLAKWEKKERKKANAEMDNPSYSDSEDAPTFMDDEEIKHGSAPISRRSES